MSDEDQSEPIIKTEHKQSVIPEEADGETCSEQCTKPENENNATSLSKRAAKRKHRIERLKIHQKEKKKKKRDAKPVGSLNFTDECLNETEYYFENGLRKVYPYYFKFCTHTKGRWVGRTVLNVCLDEFRYTSADGYELHIQNGKLTVNGENVEPGYILKNNDYVENKIHRHEMPILGSKIPILHDNDDVVVINKPCSIPVHPCGRYRHNSITFILGKEYGYKNLHMIYRLDRLTSGVLIFAKNQAKCKELLSLLQSHKLQKEYICKVDGEFPLGDISVSEPLGCLCPKLGMFKVHVDGKEAHTDMVRVSYDGKTSVVKCIPRTGRTHQIRIHLQWLGYPIVNDPLYNTPAWGPHTGKGGDWGKTDEQLLKDLTTHHHPDWHIMKASEHEPTTDADISDSSNVHSSLLNHGKASKIIDGEDSILKDEPAAKKVKLSENGKALNINENNSLNPVENPLSHSSNVVNSTYDDSKHAIDPDCQYCQTQFKDPDMEMFLHAWKYKGPDWEYVAPWPSWAGQPLE